MKNQKVTLYVTGSIAVYKSLILARQLIKAGNEVQVVMSKAAQQFINPLTFQTLTKKEVITDLFAENDPQKVVHIDLADNTDVAIVAPATANVIAKLANGIADDMVSTTLLATKAPIMVVPTMNVNMLNNPATVRNLTTLRNDGIQIMEPATGFLAEGYEGKGRMPEPEMIYDWVAGQMATDNFAPLKGKRVVITAGATIEDIDPVRYITNRSSGKMGFAIAKAAQKMGAEVTLIAANTHLPLPTGVNNVKVRGTQEMLAKVKETFTNSDILIMAAAISDFRPAVVADKKIKKVADSNQMTLELVKNPDIIKEMGQIKKPDQLVVGFAAETNDLIQNAQTKIKAKNLDMIVANDVANSQIGFNSDNNQVTFILRDGTQIKSAMASKDQIAEELLSVIHTKFLNQD